MNPLLIGLVKEGIEFVLGQVKEGKDINVQEVVNELAPTIQATEGVLADNAKEAWLAELHNGGFLATSWRPIVALTSLGGLVYEATVWPILNWLWQIPASPEYVSQAFLYSLLTLIGARAIEKINVVRKR